jgi:hypothetical protein
MISNGYTLSYPDLHCIWLRNCFANRTVNSGSLVQYAG